MIALSFNTAPTNPRIAVPCNVMPRYNRKIRKSTYATLRNAKHSKKRETTTLQTIAEKLYKQKKHDMTVCAKSQTGHISLGKSSPSLPTVQHRLYSYVNRKACRTQMPAIDRVLTYRRTSVSVDELCSLCNCQHALGGDVHVAARLLYRQLYVSWKSGKRGHRGRGYAWVGNTGRFTRQKKMLVYATKNMPSLRKRFFSSAYADILSAYVGKTRSIETVLRD